MSREATFAASNNKIAASKPKKFIVSNPYIPRLFIPTNTPSKVPIASIFKTSFPRNSYIPRLFFPSPALSRATAPAVENLISQVPSTFYQVSNSASLSKLMSSMNRDETTVTKTQNSAPSSTYIPRIYFPTKKPSKSPIALKSPLSIPPVENVISKVPFKAYPLKSTLLPVTFVPKTNSPIFISSDDISSDNGNTYDTFPSFSPSFQPSLAIDDINPTDPYISIPSISISFEPTWSPTNSTITPSGYISNISTAFIYVLFALLIPWLVIAVIVFAVQFCTKIYNTYTNKLEGKDEEKALLLPKVHNSSHSLKTAAYHSQDNRLPIPVNNMSSSSSKNIMQQNQNTNDTQHSISTDTPKNSSSKRPVLVKQDSDASFKQNLVSEESILSKPVSTIVPFSRKGVDHDVSTEESILSTPVSTIVPFSHKGVDQDVSTEESILSTPVSTIVPFSHKGVDHDVSTEESILSTPVSTIVPFSHKGVDQDVSTEESILSTPVSTIVPFSHKGVDQDVSTEESILSTPVSTIVPFSHKGVDQDVSTEESILSTPVSTIVPFSHKYPANSDEESYAMSTNGYTTTSTSSSIASSCQYNENNQILANNSILPMEHTTEEQSVTATGTIPSGKHIRRNSIPYGVNKSFH